MYKIYFKKEEKPIIIFQKVVKNKNIEKILKFFVLFKF